MSIPTVPPLSPELLHRFDRPGPRYTSYPTADRFVESFGTEDFLRALASRDASAPLSLYVHVPFCESVCYYCACNKVVTRNRAQAGAYLDLLEREMALVAAAAGPGAPVSQLHLGGGTPTFLSDEEIARLLESIGRAFRIAPHAELSIEVDPRTVDAGRLAHLRALGFNRLSLGVQDFDEAVQQAVHRVQPFEQVEALTRAARGLGFESINFDLIYGLPRQTAESFARTVAQVANLRPDRIALYAYAHLPERFKPQRRIAVEELPGASGRVAMLGGAIAGFLSHGYQYIGMDHFALPGDALAVARREGRLHRSFQGYTVQPDGDLVGLGVSAIGRIGPVYYQNEKSLPQYAEALQQGRLPVARGLELTHDDRVRRDIVMALMCQGRVDFEAIERAHPGVEMCRHFAAELVRLEDMAAQGLVEIEPAAIQVTAPGWFLVRGVAAVFDRYLGGNPLRDVGVPGRFSRMV